MEYKEIKKRNGEVIVFCNFEELLKEITGYGSIEEVEAHCPGNENEYICHCPFCREEGHTKHKLYIKKDLTVGHCFVCGRAFVHVTDEVSIDYDIPTFTSFSGWGGTKQIELPKFLKPEWNLDNFYNDFTDSDPKGESYLSTRHPFMVDIAKLLGFKYNNGNVVIPFRYKGNVIYYQIRFSGKNKTIRYFFPPVNQKCPYILDFGEGKKRLIICEGVFDAISLMIQAPDYIPVAVLGSSISDYQIEYLREYLPEEIVIMMDETEISKRIADKIKSKIDYCPIRIIPTFGDDPEEILNKKIKQGVDLQWIKPVENKPKFNKYFSPTW